MFREYPIVVSSHARAPARHVVVIVIDTLRADHLSCYGYERQVSPHIDALAAEGTLFSAMYANGNWTKPSIAALFTGLWPSETGAMALWADRDNPELGQAALCSSVPTLAEVFDARGYRTGGFVQNPHIDGSLGFGRGFDSYGQFEDCDNSVRAFLEWIGTPGGDDRVFAYLHLLEPHGPYDPREPFREVFASGLKSEFFEMTSGAYPTWGAYRDEVNQGEIVPAPGILSGLRDLYDGEILWSDDAVGRIVAALESLGVYEETLLVVTSDHGENFYEHNKLAHPTTTFFEEQINVPLVVKFPKSWNIPSGRVGGPAQMIDLTATLAAASGAAALGRGRDLTPFVTAGKIPAETIVTESMGGVVARFGHLKAYCRLPDEDNPHITIRKLYDLARDSSENLDVLSKKPSFAARAERRLGSWRAFTQCQALKNTAGDEPERASPELLRQLRALGYVGATAAPSPDE